MNKEKLKQLQLYEQNMQVLRVQKQRLQQQLSEYSGAYDEVQRENKQIYQVIGPIMVRADKNVVAKDLEEKKDLLTIRIKNIEKQEKSMQEQAAALQAELLPELKDASGT